MTKGHLRILRENYEKACNAYLLALANVWGWNCKSYGYWVADEIGGVYIYADDTFINMDDIIFCVENNISEQTYNAWQDYCIWADEFNQHKPNLKSWIMGCQRVDEETQKKLTDMKRELETLMQETKEKF